MDRNFVISASVAAAFHAGLLFGIPGSPAKPAAEKVTTKLIDAFKIFEEPPPPPEDLAEKSAALGSSDLAPRAPEPPINPTMTDFVVTAPISTPTTVTVPVHTIPLGPPGDMLGDINGAPDGKNPTFTFVDLDGAPRTRMQTAPSYPFEAKRQGVTGDVLVEFTVDESGSVLSPHVVKSSNPVFDDPAVRAVARWKFEPGKRGGRVVRFKMAVPIVFNLNDSL